MASNQLGKKSGHDSFGGVDQLQTVSEASHLPKPNRGDEDDDLPSVYSSSSNLSSPQYTGKPLQNFELSEETFDLEDGFERTPSRPRRRGWFWEYMTVRARRKYEPVDQELTGSGVLSNMNIPQGWNSRANRGWFNYCIFGGISGCTVLAFLFVINLVLGLATLFWSGNLDTTLQNWGKPGSGTEGLAWYPTDFTRDINPIPCHSHNDYWRKVPLFSALRAGCTGVEADVWLFDEDLYVGHNTASLTRNRTFESLYINPLVEILERQNPNTDFYNGTNHGIFDTDPGKPLTLLVDVKTSGAETWPWVLAQLQPLRERGWLSYVEGNTLYTRQVTVVGTGNTPFDVLTANTTYRDAFFDAPLNDIWEAQHTTQEMKDQPASDSAPGESSEEEKGRAEKASDLNSASPTYRSSTSTISKNKVFNAGQGQSGVSPTDEFNELNSYYASASFNEAVGRIWRGRLSSRQKNIIRGQIRGAHRRGLKVRYWDLPSWPLGLRNHVWDVLIREGVDMLNIDDLRAASKQVW